MDSGQLGLTLNTAGVLQHYHTVTLNSVSTASKRNGSSTEHSTAAYEELFAGLLVCSGKMLPPPLDLFQAIVFYVSLIPLSGHL